MGRKKISTTVYLDAWQLDALKALHERTKMPMANMIRAALDEWLEKNVDAQHLALYKKAAARTELTAAIEDLKARLVALEERVEPHTSLLRGQEPQLDGDDAEDTDTED